MADDPVKFPKPDKGRKPPVRQGGDGGEAETGQDPSGDTNWRGLALFGLCILVLLLALWAVNTENLTYKEITTAKFDQLLADKRIVAVTFKREVATRSAWLEGTMAKTPELAAKARVQTNERLAAIEAGKDPDKAVPKEARVEVSGFRTAVDRTQFDEELKQRLVAAGIEHFKIEFQDNWLMALLTTFLPFVIIMVIIYLLFRQQLRMAGKNAFSFGKSKARMLAQDRNKITFKDVAGIEEAKEELVEIVEFLRDPRKFQKLGGRIPKGVLMIGPPGTGKTLLAKAIAGEADVPFFSISGSDFVEMFVGVGASRVRDMFEQGKKNAPCLIFIDEIDAVGRSRGTGMGGGHDEREQTLNAMLVEMDGIETQEGVIIIAATNRKDVLDPALLRPGRFDREVHIHLPDVRGREAILKVHARNVKLGKEVDLALIARGTPGFSGAELANLINESALIAASRNKDSIGQSDLEEARDKVRWGRERRSMAMTEDEKRTTAFHEAGHALLNILLEHTDPLHKVSIIPRGPALGVTMALPEKDKFSAWKKELIDMLCMIMGGRVAEEIFVGDVSSGAAGDIQQATHYARKMVCEWGMSDELGMVQYSDDSSMSFLGRELGHTRSYSEKTAQQIDAEVLKLVNTAYQRATDLITEHRDAMHKITEALLEFETLEGSQIEDIVKYGEMKNPPPSDVEGTANPNPEEPLPANPKPDEDKSDDGLLPGLEGAPAGA